MNEEERMEFIENLLDSKAIVSEEEIKREFKEDPELRRSYVNQQFVHALLVSRHKMCTRDASASEQIERVMNLIDTVEKRRTKGGLLTFFRIAATVAAVVAIVTVLMFLPSSRVEAEAVIKMARQKSFEEIDRTYSLKVTFHLLRGSYAMEGFLYVCGAEKMVAELNTPQGRVIYGTNGKEEWLIPPCGPIFTRKDRDALQVINPEAVELPLMSMGRLMAWKDKFDLKIVGEARLAKYPGLPLVIVECTLHPNIKDNSLQKAKYWVDRETGMVVISELLFTGGYRTPFNKTVTIEFIKEEKREDGFYHYNAHNSDGRPLFDREKHKELLDSYRKSIGQNPENKKK